MFALIERIVKAKIIAPVIELKIIKGTSVKRFSPNATSNITQINAKTKTLKWKICRNLIKIVSDEIPKHAIYNPIRVIILKEKTKFKIPIKPEKESHEPRNKLESML